MSPFGAASRPLVSAALEQMIDRSVDTKKETGREGERKPVGFLNVSAQQLSLSKAAKVEQLFFGPHAIVICIFSCCRCCRVIPRQAGSCLSGKRVAELSV